MPFVASSRHRPAGPGVAGLGPGLRGGVQCRAKPEAEGELSLYSLWVRPPWPPACCIAAPEMGKHHAQWLSDCVTGCSCRRLPWDGMLGVPGQWVFWPPSGRGSLVLRLGRVSIPAAVSVCAGLCMVASALVPCSCCHACEPRTRGLLYEQQVVIAIAMVCVTAWCCSSVSIALHRCCLPCLTCVFSCRCLCDQCGVAPGWQSPRHLPLVGDMAGWLEAVMVWAACVKLAVCVRSR